MICLSIVFGVSVDTDGGGAMSTETTHIFRWPSLSTGIGNANNHLDLKILRCFKNKKVNKYLSKSWRTGKIEFERSAKNCPQSMHVGALPWSWKEKQKKCFPPFA